MRRGQGPLASRCPRGSRPSAGQPGASWSPRSTPGRRDTTHAAEIDPWRREGARTTTPHPLTCGGWAPGPRRQPRAAEGRWRLDGDHGDQLGKMGSRAAEGAGPARGARGPTATAAAAAASGAAWAAGEPGGPHEWDPAAAAAAAGGWRAGPAPSRDPALRRPLPAFPRVPPPNALTPLPTSCAAGPRPRPLRCSAPR